MSRETFTIFLVTIQTDHGPKTSAYRNHEIAMDRFIEDIARGIPVTFEGVEYTE